MAPTVAEAGPSAEPTYAVELLHGGRAVERPCRDLDEFRGYMLQHAAFNPDNAKGVVRGVIRFRHPALDRGLRLVDMPGVNAASPAVNQEARRFLRECTQAVVAVTKDRTGYGAVTEAISDLGVRPEHVQAVVLNTPQDYFCDGLDKHPDDVLRREIETTRRLAAEAMKLPPDKIFVINLKGWYEHRVWGKKLAIDTPAHIDEIERFSRVLWKYVRDHGVAEVIAQAADQATAALTELSRRLSQRQPVLKALLAGDPGVAAEIRRQFDGAAQVGKETWGKVAGAKIAEGVADKYWLEYQQAVDAARLTLLAAVDNVLASVKKIEGRVGAGRADVWRKEVEQKRVSAFEAIDAARSKLLTGPVFEYFQSFANRGIQEVYRRVWVLAAVPLNEQMQVTLDGLNRTKLGELSPGVMEQVVKWGVIAGSTAVVSSLSGGGGTAVLVTLLGLTPVGGLVAGGVLGAAAAYGLWQAIRGDAVRDNLVRGLEEFRGRAERELSTSSGGPQRQGWQKDVARLSEMVGQCLERQMAQLLALLTAPKGVDRRALSDYVAELEHAVRELGERREELAEVRAEAEQLGG